MRSIGDQMMRQLREVCKEEGGVGQFQELQDLCDQYSTKEIDDTIKSLSMVQNPILEFFSRSVRHVSRGPLKMIKLMLTLALVHGNPLFA